MLNAKYNQVKCLTVLLVIFLLLISLPDLHSQQTPVSNKPLTLDEAINFGLSHYPAIRASLERSAAASAGVGLSRTIYLPRVDLLWQSNRATRNNIFGLLLS
jgi:outer membrane protein